MLISISVYVCSFPSFSSLSCHILFLILPPSLDSSHQALLIRNLSLIASSQVGLPMCSLSFLIHPFHLSLLCFHSFSLSFPIPSVLKIVDSLPTPSCLFCSLDSYPFYHLIPLCRFSLSLCSPHHYNVFHVPLSSTPISCP